MYFTKYYFHRNDKVMLMLTNVHDTTHFSARIIDMPQSNQSEKINFIDTEYMKIKFKIQEYYQNVENRYINNFYFF